MSDILQDRFTVTVADQQYVFRIPSIRYEVEMDYKAADVRRRCYPEAGGILGAISYQAVQFSRACAILELYLLSATTLWPYGFDDNDVNKVDFGKPPKVDFEKFPLYSADLVAQVGDAFEAEYARFRQRRTTNNPSAGG